MTAGQDQTRIRRYLLGDLPREEEGQFEQEFFNDDDVFEQVRAVEDELVREDDLIDEYVRGELTGRLRRRVESRLVASPEWRHRIAIARAMQATLFRSAPRPPAVGVSGWIQRLVDVDNRVLRFAPALALLLIAAGAVTLLRNDIASISARLVRHQEQPPLARPAPDGTTARQPNRIEPLVFSVALSPGLLRDAAGGQRVEIPPGIEILRLELRIDGTPHFNRYRVDIQTPEGKSVWTQNGAPTSVASGSAITSVAVEVPAHLLPRGDYVVSVNAENADRSSDGADYIFSVAGR